MRHIYDGGSAVIYCGQNSAPRDKSVHLDVYSSDRRQKDPYCPACKRVANAKIHRYNQAYGQGTRG